MSSGLVLRTLLPEDASAFTPLKPVTMSGEPGEDTPVFEDIKPPTRSLENPPDLAQVRWRPAVCRGAAGRGQLRPLRCTEAANASCKRKCGFSLNSALFFRSLLKHLCRFVRSCFPLCRIFFWACWVSFFFFFFSSCLSSKRPVACFGGDPGSCSLPAAGARFLSPRAGR